MPQVFEVGIDFQGTGYPYLLEAYIPGVNMSFAYLKSPTYWEKTLPIELVRIYQTIQATNGPMSLKPGGISWMVCFVLPDLKAGTNKSRKLASP